MKSIVRWLGRTGLLFLALTAAMLAYAVWHSGDVDALRQQPEMHQRQAQALDELAASLEALRQQRRSELSTLTTYLRTQSEAQLQARLAAEKKQRDKLVADKTRFGSVLNIVTLDIASIAAERRRALELAFVERKIAGLTLAVDNRAKRGSAAQSWRAARTACQEAERKLKVFNDQNVLIRTGQEIFQGTDDALKKKQQAECTKAKNRQATLLKLARTQVWINDVLPIAVDDLRARAGVERQQAEDALSAKAVKAAERYHLGAIMRYAGLALIVIIGSPYVVRFFCYYLLAPVAARGGGIRLVAPGGPRGPMPTASPSSSSVAVRLAPGEELLVRQDFLQTTSHIGNHRTQWFLDSGHPLMSLAAGLTFLTRIRGQGETTTVSAVRDPFAEVTIVMLGEGASCVLQPRALAAVVQPIERPLVIRSKWRLGSVSAWLTMQLRYFIFQGPCRLVIKGGRGVRIEPAEHGRIFGQDQLVGFSADLSYSVTRNETFWPYLRGAAPLLKDRVMNGQGILIIEEAPLAGRNGGEPRRGIEGVVDAGMKLVGL